MLASYVKSTFMLIGFLNSSCLKFSMNLTKGSPIVKIAECKLLQIYFDMNEFGTVTINLITNVRLRLIII